MTHQKYTGSLSRERGITLVEILLVISLLVVVLSFAIPSMSSATAKVDMTAAVENVEYSIKTARNTARLHETAIAVDFKSYAGEQAQVIAFRRVKPGPGAGIPEYRLSEDIELVSNQPSFVFDNRGLVRNPGTITLVSKIDDTVSATVDVR
jgi:Tfp pilus assembly protein PilE